MSRDDLTKEQRQAAIDKYNSGKALLSGNSRIRSVSLSENILNVMWFRQPNEYFCGPATVKQTMHYIEGVSDDMEEIALFLEPSAVRGTDTNKMCEYLNLYGNLYYEVLWWWADANAFSNMVISDTDNDLPIIGNIQVYSGSLGEWLYPTDGHYINYNGYSSNGEVFHVTDPYADRYGIMDGKYTVSNDEAERVTTRIIW